MSKKKSFNTNAFKRIKNWVDKVHMGDTIADQVKYVFDKNGYELEAVERKPEVRMVVDNLSGEEKRFLNPGDHSGGEKETIPGTDTGNGKAVQVKFHGDTLEDQIANAQAVFDQFNLGENGLSDEFIAALENGELSDKVKEAYGPSRFGEQSAALKEELSWVDVEGNATELVKTQGQAAAFGPRQNKERVFLCQYPIYVQGTTSIAELVESSGMYVAVNQHWQTGEDETKPIVPSVGVHYYGKNADQIPVVTLSTDGIVKDITLANGRTLTPFPEGAEKRMAKKRQKLHARKAKEMAK